MGDGEREGEAGAITMTNSGNATGHVFGEAAGDVEAEAGAAGAHSDINRTLDDSLVDFAPNFRRESGTKIANGDFKPPFAIAYGEASGGIGGGIVQRVGAEVVDDTEE